MEVKGEEKAKASTVSGLVSAKSFPGIIFKYKNVRENRGVQISAVEEN